jgi:hypothetical protein
MGGGGGGPDYAQIEREGGVACVLIASAFDGVLQKWLADNWTVVDTASGAQWHLVVPVSHTLTFGAPFKPAHYDTALARDFARSFGIGPQSKPCLVIDSFNEDEQQVRVRLPETEAELSALFRAIDDFVATRKSASQHPLTGAERRAFSHRLTAHLLSKKFRRNALSLVKKGAAPAGRLAAMGFG